MKIDFILDEGPSKEDSYLIKGDIFGVFDGFNSLDKFTDENGKTGGLIAATIAKDEFSRGDKDLRHLSLETNKKIRETMLASNIDMSKKSSLWGTMIAAVRIKNNSFEWVQIGDSLILVIYKDNSFKLLVEDYNHDKEVLKIWKEFAKQKKENIRGLIENGPLIETRKEINETYGALTGEDGARAFLKGGEESLENVKHILIFTDGLFIPKENPSEDDNWDMFVNFFLKGGLSEVKDFVRGLEKNDPKCWKYPRFKQYDDIAAISISFSNGTL